ncbi:FecCD family ABC transporter permease [Streptomyces sp. 4N509B]|uniref:FecCD family ABC transporter permease n=1 Tax=Streptomyces sp. 4N509B TaxID=3457413 RepID=UPI003FD345BA
MALLLLSAVALLAAAGASLCVGAGTVPLDAVWPALTDGDGPAGGDARLIVREVRVPRTVLAVAVGAALGAAGTLIQTLTRNPLAEPGVLGVTFGAGFAISLGAALGVAGSQATQLALAFVGSLLAAVLVHAVGGTSPLRLLLAGTALSFVLGGLALGMRLLDPDVLDRHRFWSVGSLAGREQIALTLPLLLIALALVGALAVTGPLNALGLGETVAHTLGAHVTRTRVAVLALVTVLAGTATAVAGPIAFVGLIVPHLARRAAGGSLRWLMAYTMLLGPLLLLAADVAARVLLPTGEVPVAVVTAFLGGPVLIWAVRRRGAVAL